MDDAVYTVNTDSAVLTLTVPAGAFEEKVKLKAEAIQDGSEEHQVLSDQIHEEGYRADSFTAFDVKFVDEAGEEVEPTEEVKVSIQFKKNAVASDTAENLEETKILHIHEDVITELSEIEIQDSTEDSEKTAKLTFGVNEFSILLAFNEAAVGVAEVNGTAYDTLEDAFAAAGDGDTVKVLKNCELSNTISVEKALTLNLNEKVVKVKIVPEAKAAQTISAFTVAESATFTVLNGLLGGIGSTADNRAIESNGGKVILKDTILAGFQALSGNGGAVLMNGGTLEAEGCSFGYYTKEENNYKEYSTQGNFAQSGGAVYASQAAVKMEKCNVFYNSAIDENGTTGQYWYGGGALFADGGTVTLTENYFFYNTSKDYGGAIHLDAVQTAELTGNRIRNSHAFNHRIEEKGARGGDGGAIYSRISKTVTLKNNTITGGTSMGNGAGLYVIGAADCILTLEGNTISGNDAGQRGGGMKLDMDKNSQVNLISGLISENSSSGFGGGIDYTKHENPTLHLTNVLITGNQASRGAGIWSCPTSETEIYSTLGGAFYGNTATGSTGGISYSYEASGDEIRYEGVDTPDKFAIQSNPPSATTHISVSKRSLGGGVIQWYLDEAESRYQAGNPEADPAIYTNTNLSFGLHGELSEEHQKLASSEAQLVIRDNVSKRGGGIATNSPIVIGMEYADVAVEVTKKWTEETHPDHVYVALYRVGDASGEKVKLDSHVELNAENNWSASFADLPSKCVTNGEVEDCHYIVEEETVEGWKESSSAEYDKENKTYKITLTNTPIQYGSLTVSKEVTGSGDKEKEFPFKVTLQGETAMNGTYGDMEFVDNVVTFTLKHGESKSAAGLPEGVAYTVEESGNEGYTVTKTGDVGTIVGGETAVVKFVNAMNGGENPNPNPNPNPTPDNNGGGSSGGHGGGGGSSRRGSSTTTSSGPAAEPTEPVTPVEPEPQPVVLTEGLPKTGEDRMDVPMILLTVGMMAAAYVLMTGRKKTEE